MAAPGCSPARRAPTGWHDDLTSRCWTRATFHQGRTAHYADANSTDEARLSFLVTFTDADATYRPLPGHDPLDLRPGQPLPDHRYPRTPRRNGNP